MKFAYCLRIVFVTGKYTDIFRGGGGYLGLGWTSIGRIFLGEENFRGMENFPRKFYTMSIDRIPIRNSF